MYIHNSQCVIVLCKLQIAHIKLHADDHNYAFDEQATI